MTPRVPLRSISEEQAIGALECAIGAARGALEFIAY